MVYNENLKKKVEILVKEDDNTLLRKKRVKKTYTSKLKETKLTNVVVNIFDM